MVKTEYYTTRKDGVRLKRTYSDTGLPIIQNETGIEYAEAIDVEDTNYTYSEKEEGEKIADNGRNQDVS